MSSDAASCRNGRRVALCACSAPPLSRALYFSRNDEEFIHVQLHPGACAKWQFVR